ncbi:TetR family transcriptional regulator [Dongia deserti]|uniref:TetR family transcriptional regulator n=1 Tax=Dongia deserti TaxID=2268030 RepID=UPI000E654CD9|nr:TetR family transcriptional regulator [Dongia deserti]
MNDVASDGILTREKILEAAEEVLRRFGPSKATVVDVARALGVSHGSVYRHFPSKAALRDAVLERWLHRITEPLEEIVRGRQPAPERLRLWLEQLMAVKRRRALNEPELFATYISLAGDAREVTKAHVDALIDQATRIIADGVKSGTIMAKDAGVAARSVFDATARFHNPAHAGEWADPAIDQAFEGVWALLKAALTARSGPKRR